MDEDFVIAPNDNRLVGTKIILGLESWDFGGWYVIKYIGVDYLVLEDHNGKEQIRSRAMPWKLLEPSNIVKTVEEKVNIIICEI